MGMPAGAVLLPWLHTGMMPPHAGAAVRSRPAQVGSVWPGSQGTHWPMGDAGQALPQIEVASPTQTLSHPTVQQ
jgi:hypothetical protein